MDPHSHRSHQNPSVQYLCFLPQSPSLVSSNFQEHREHATPMKCAWPFRCTVNRACLETGPLSVRFDSLASTSNTGYRTSGFCLSRPLFSCSKIQQ